MLARGVWLGLMGWFIGMTTPHAEAIVQAPSQAEIQSAIERGQKAAQNRTPPNQLYWRFGEPEGRHQPYGYLMTKLNGIAVLSSHFGLRGEHPARQDVQRVLDEKFLQVVVHLFGSSPTFAMGTYLLFQQHEQLIKPERIRFDARAQAVDQENGERIYRAKVVASFAFGSFDPQAPTIIKVFPGDGGEVKFDLEFSAIP